MLNSDLIKEALKYAGVKSKSALLEEALRVYVQVKSRELDNKSYLEKVSDLQARLAGVLFREGSHELIRSDRQR